MVSALKPDDFATFFREVHGVDKTPFKWQEQLLEHVITQRRWPNIIDLPTDSGKTACIDIAVFALALAANDEATWCPRRIVMVVDRRVVVDQAARRGRRIAEALSAAPPGSVCQKIAESLSALSAEGVPLRVAVLRGGIPRDAGWARTPDQPLVIASTVDQIGSRLLFRGYGVTWSMRPVHAGLIGNDTLILLDEVHLSRPFQQTLRAITRLRSHGHASGPWQIVALSATPGAGEEQPLTLPDADRQQGVLKKRIEASKPATLIECDGRETLIAEAAKHASALLTRPMGKPHRAIAIVVNRVDTAHRIAQILRCVPEVVQAADVVLLTGRMRPLERDDRVNAIEPRVGAIEGRRSNEARPIIVVATQCIEAGADFDFDALIAEHASLDALRQRFGRLDRLGEYGRAEAMVIVGKERNDKGGFDVVADDPIYGESLAATWKALLKWAKEKNKGARKPRQKDDDKLKPSAAILDFGIASMEARLAGQNPSDLLAPKSRAPALFPAYLDIWAQTAPPPFAEPEVSLFLQGPKRRPADVQIVWRCDLDDSEVWESDDDEEEVAIERIAAMPPSSLEAVSVPFFVARSWLAGKRGPGVIADVDRPPTRPPTEDLSERQHTRPSSDIVRAVVWRGNERQEARRKKQVPAEQRDEEEQSDNRSFVLTKETIEYLRPGDTVVVPTSYGGLFDGSFDPSATEAVADLAERACLFGRGRAVLRLHLSVLASLDITLHEDKPSARETVEPWIRIFVKALAQAERIEVDEHLVLLKSRHRIDLKSLLALEDAVEEEEVTQAETSSLTGRAVKLSAHSGHVEAWARTFAKKLRLPTDIAGTLAFAGWLHDVGKADPRFQRLLRDGGDVSLLKDQLRWPNDWILAKSAMGVQERRRARLASLRSGYPPGTRHEVLSLAMIQDNETIRDEARRRGVRDLDLLFHLVASHHGWCRPFAPAVNEPEQALRVELQHGDITLFAPARHGLERLDSPLADRFARLGRDYGWLQLAWFEAILRLADHRASEQEVADGDS